MGKGKEMKAFSACALALACVFASSAASAETLAWYHFDDKAPGTVMAAGETVADAINVEAAARGWAINSATQTDSADYTHLRPRFARSAGPMVYDPVTGARTPNTAAMRFVTENAIMPGTSTKYDWVNGGCLRVDARTAEPKKSMTLEFFFCMRQKPFGNTFAPVVGKLRDTNFTAEAWAVYVTSNGKLSLRMSNGNAAANAGTGGVGAFVADGGWHHLALVYKEGEPKAWLYVDYQRVYEMAVKSVADIFYGNSTTADATPLYIGGYPFRNSSYGYRKFDGCVDEVRISDEALASSQFLRLRDDDADVISRIRFDSPIGMDALKFTTNPNLLLDLGCMVTNSAKTEACGVVSNDAARAIRENFYAEAVANKGFVTHPGGATSGTPYLKVANLSHYLDRTKDSFTVEGFFRVDGKFTTGNGRKETVFKWGSKPICGFVLQANDASSAQTKPHFILTYNHNDVWKGISTVYADYDDGNWHHCADVYDVAARQMRFYYDGALICVVNNVTNSVADGHGLFLGCDESAGTALKGALGDFRVTKRALYPDEFLNANAVKAAEGKTLAFFNFENDYATSVNADLIGEGEGLKHGDGAAPTFAAWPKGGLLMDGRAAGQTPLANAAWLNFQDSLFGVKNYTPLFVQRDFTVEFFARFTELKNNANLIRYANGTGDYNADPVWALYRNKGVTNGKQLQARIQMVNNGVSASNYDLTANFDAKVDDGRLHHYALTFETKSGPKTEVCLYRDYVQKGSKTINGVVDFARTDSSGNLNGRLCFGASSKDNTVSGFVDALRFSKGVLSTNEFMRLEKRGTAILVR